VLKRLGHKLRCDTRLCALDCFTITPCNDLEAFQQTKAFVHESTDGGPSGRKSLMLNDRESACLEKPKNLGVVHACLRMIFRQVACPNHGARELGIVPPKEFSRPAPNPGQDISQVTHELGSCDIDGVKGARPEPISRNRGIPIRIKKAAEAHMGGGMFHHGRVGVQVVKHRTESDQVKTLIGRFQESLDWARDERWRIALRERLFFSTNPTYDRKYPQQSRPILARTSLA